MWNGYPVEILGRTEVQINDNNFNIPPGIQKVLVDSPYNTNKSMNDMDKVVLQICYKKLIFVTVYQQRVICQVVIIILKTILIMMWEKFWI